MIEIRELVLKAAVKPSQENKPAVNPQNPPSIDEAQIQQYLNKLNER